MRIFVPIIAALLLYSSSFAQTQAPTATPESPPALENPTVQRNFRFSIGGVVEAQFGLASSGAVSGLSAFTLSFSGSLGAEDAPSAAFNANLRSSFDAASGATRVDLGETVLTAYVGAFDLSAGNLIVNWGAVDAFSVVSNINPVDFASQQRIPVPAIRALWNLSNDLRLEGVIVPIFTPSALPAMTGAAPAVPSPPGVTIIGQNPPLDNRPAARLENVQYGIRLGGNLALFDGGDFGLSFYGGPRHTPTIAVRLIPSAQAGQFTAQPVLNYDWIHVLGVEANLSLGDVAVRAEAAYTFTQDPSGANLEIGNPSLAMTAQGEFRVSGINLTGLVNAQWRKGESGAGDAYNLNAGLIASTELDNRTNFSIVWVQSLTDGSGLVAPNFTYTLADGFKLEGSASVNYGRLGSSLNPSGVFGAQLRFGLKFSF